MSLKTWNPLLQGRLKIREDGSFGTECIIRYEDDDGFTIFTGECYSHMKTDSLCQFQEQTVRTDEWPEAD